MDRMSSVATEALGDFVDSVCLPPKVQATSLVEIMARTMEA